MAEMHRPHAADGDVNIHAVFAFGFGLLVIGAIVSLLVVVLFRYFDVRDAARVPPEYPLAISQETRVPPEPRLQTDPRQELSDMRAKEDQRLTTYGWVDEKAGVVRIPIDEAMRLTLERGLPARSEQAR